MCLFPFIVSTFLHRRLHFIFRSTFHCFFFLICDLLLILIFPDSFEGRIYGCSRQFDSLETFDAWRERNKKWNNYSDHIFVHLSIAGQIHNSITSTIFLVKLSFLSWEICLLEEMSASPLWLDELKWISKERRREKKKGFSGMKIQISILPPEPSPLFMSQ